MSKVVSISEAKKSKIKTDRFTLATMNTTRRKPIRLGHDNMEESI